jgi:hypothetical protein
VDAISTRATVWLGLCANALPLGLAHQLELGFPPMIDGVESRPAEV